MNSKPDNPNPNPNPLRFASVLAQVSLVALACLTFLSPGSRTTLVTVGVYALFFVVGGALLHRAWRAGILKLTVRELHARRMQGDLLEAIALLAGAAAIMRLSIA
ncbi:MAG: hypothetical protein IH627_10510 [Rubrivivax sp.]|nr:hypothetical protein [Rubrivivax sp.]